MIKNQMTYNEFAQTHNTSVFQEAVTKGYNASIYGDIYLTGYAYIIWTRLPSFLKDATADTIGDFQDITRILYKSVEIPNVTLNTTDVVTGFAGTNKVSIPTSIDKDNTLTITYNELSGTPITRLHQVWMTGIRDYTSGVSDIANYGIKTYGADLLYITTKPVHYQTQGSLGSALGQVQNEKIIETAHLFTDVFPTIDNQANFNMSLETSDKVEVNIPYKFTEMFMGDAVNKLAIEKLGDVIKLKDMENYNYDNAVGMTFK